MYICTNYCKRAPRTKLKSIHMFIFCPICGTLLTLQEGKNGLEYQCATCTYIWQVKRRHSTRKYPRLKEVDEVLSDASIWENADATDEKCPKCEHPRAYFMQMQTRSADEPMTNFYQCCNKECSNRWKE